MTGLLDGLSMVLAFLAHYHRRSDSYLLSNSPLVLCIPHMIRRRLKFIRIRTIQMLLYSLVRSLLLHAIYLPYTID